MQRSHAGQYVAIATATAAFLLVSTIIASAHSESAQSAEPSAWSQIHEEQMSVDSHGKHRASCNVLQFVDIYGVDAANGVVVIATAAVTACRQQ